MRIIAGRHRGRKLAAPSGRTVRPSSDRLRQALFNILAHGKHGVELNGARVVDAFAGTGAIGLEALSRGARHAVFIENEPTALELLRKNVAHCGEGEHADVIRADATNPPPARMACDLAFLDPPYGEGRVLPALNALATKGWFKQGALCIVEIANAEPFSAPTGFDLLEERTYGAARIVILRRLNPIQSR